MYVASHHTIDELRDLARKEDNAVIRTRLHVIIAAIQLRPAYQIAQDFGYSIRAICYWVHRYNQDPVSGLKDAPRPGKKAALQSCDLDRFCNRLDQGPLVSDRVCVFHGKDLQMILKNEFGKLRSLSGIYYLLRSLNYRWLVPRPQHHLANLQAQEAFKREAKLKIEEIQKQHLSDPVEIWFEDEARFGQQGTMTRVWARKGSRPRAIRQTQYGNLYVITATCPAKGVAEAMIMPYLNTEVFSAFLQQLSESADGRRQRVLILDRAGYHTAKSLKIPENIHLLHLPPYSPELNPVENLWNYFRSHYWSNRYYEDIEALEQQAIESWKDLCLDPEKIKSICAVSYL